MPGSSVDVGLSVDVGGEGGGRGGVWDPVTIFGQLPVSLPLPVGGGGDDCVL